MKEKMRVGIIGHAAQGKKAYDGQTVSTRLWLDEMENAEPVGSVYVVDTYQYRKRCLIVLWQWIRCLLTCTHVVVMLSGNGLRFFMPLIYMSSKLFKTKFFHRVIGGEIDNFFKNNPKYIPYANAMEVNWVQSHSLVEKLKKMGVNNAEYLENFRNIKPAALPQEPKIYEKPFRFCTFSRVSEAKGIGLAIEAVAAVNKKLGAGTATLDIYGPLEDAYRETFTALTEKHSDCVCYKGSVQSNRSVEVLKDYDLHLFPTTWSGEGFPGTILECYYAGLPTIASTWAYNTEYIENWKTGLLYDWEHPEQLEEKILEAIEKCDRIGAMRTFCVQESKKYLKEVVMEKILTRMKNA